MESKEATMDSPEALESWLDDHRSLSAMVATDPCIVAICTLEYSHDGQHAPSARD